MDKKVYKLSEFRKHIREAFNLASSDVDVYIERYDEKYILIPVSYYEELLKPDTSEPKVIKTSKQANEAVKPLQKKKNVEPITYHKKSNWGA